MRSLKRPLSILIAALMLVSVMVIAPVTASADGNTVQHYVEKWEQLEVVTGKYYRVKDLFQNFAFARVDPAITFDNDFDHAWNQTGDLTLVAHNKYVVNGFNSGEHYGRGLNGFWGDDDAPGRAGDGYIYFSDELNSDTANWYVKTWEIFTLTKHEKKTETSGTKTNIEYYTDGKNDGRYFVAKGDTYEEVTEVFFDYVTASGEGINYGGAFIAGDGDTANYYGEIGTLNNNTIFGVQEAIDVNNGSIRFVTVIDNAIAQEADDYGYVVAKTKKTAADAMDLSGNFGVNSANTLTLSCKGTSNQICGNYGVYDEDTAYKYVTFAVNDLNDAAIESGWTVVTRFYVEKNGFYTYFKYGTKNGIAHAISIS